MSNDAIRSLVEQAVAERYAAWAIRHPSLAAVIDQVTLRQQAVESLRATAGYRQAVEAYRQAQVEQTLLGELLTLADVVLANILK